MLKKIYQIFFILLFAVILCTPIVFTDWSTKGVSEEENRNLAEAPELFVDGKFNEEFTSDTEAWFMDHMGKRQELINLNAWLQYFGFQRLLVTDHYLGRDGNLNYATEAMLKDYAHLNLREETEVAEIGDAYQTMSDWCTEKGIQFYYVQCYDKHSIYPEQFMDTVNQIGSVSKTDQVISYLQNNTTVNTISLKDVLIDSKETYETYSNWGDPSHWTERGAFIGYQTIMEEVNRNNNFELKILEEKDYDIRVADNGKTYNKYIHQEDLLETFTIREPQAVRGDMADIEGLETTWGEDIRHSVWKNPNAGTDKKLLLMCDSYTNSFIVEDYAESFAEVWLVWGAYTKDFCEIVEVYNPDIVIYECAERVDLSSHVVKLAKGM